jgi:DNA adenine methylase
LKWHIDGGKGAFNGKLAKWVIGLMPKHLHYVEPYAGGLSVLLAKEHEGVSEVVNDKHGWLTCFWHVMINPTLFAAFERHVQGAPFAERLFGEATDVMATDPELPVRDPVAAAVAFFIANRQSHSGRMKDFAPLSRTRTRRGMNEQASAWLTAVEGLPEVHARLKRVVVLNRDALDVIRQQDGPDTLYYCDPPYCHGTRATTGEYAFEMTDLAHRELLMALTLIKGKFLLSGYRSDLYDAHADEYGWTRHEFKIPNNAAGGKKKREMTECVWTNF